MKTLYIMRHAKSSYGDNGLDDFDRPLNNEGQENAPLMGERLAKRGIKPDLMLSSPAVRAITTANIVCDALNLDTANIQQDSNLYLADLFGLMAVINGIDDNIDSIFIWGHNPGLTQLVNWISGETIDNIPSGGICQVDCDTEDWKSVGMKCGELQFYDYPLKKASEA